jgi:hypothetical protein
MFPAHRQLPQLRELTIREVIHANGPAAATDFALLASCCPGLKSLHLSGLQPLQSAACLPKLSCLACLCFGPDGCTSGSGVVKAICQLTGLRSLMLHDAQPNELLRELVQLTQLRQLTNLYCRSLAEDISAALYCEVSPLMTRVCWNFLPHFHDVFVWLLVSLTQNVSYLPTIPP